MLVEVIIGLIVDVAVAGLLATTIVFCWKLNKRILVLQDSKGDMAQLIRKFDEATEKASVSINELQNASKKLNEDMSSKIQKANFIADDLAFMIEKGNKVADKMQGAASASAPAAVSPKAAAGGRITGRTAPENKRGNAEASEAPVANAASNPKGQGGRASAALDSVMERLGNRGDAAKPAAASNNGPRVATSTMRNRSKTEQELLDALKNEV